LLLAGIIHQGMPKEWRSTADAGMTQNVQID